MYFPNGLAGIWDKHGNKLVSCVKNMKCETALKSMIKTKRLAKAEASSE